MLVGWVRLAVPVALAIVGIALIRGRAPAERLRLSLGFALLAVAATGLLQLSLGPDSWGAPLDEFQDAGGYMGAAIALPLERVLATAGAALVLDRRRAREHPHPHSSHTARDRLRRR